MHKAGIVVVWEENGADWDPLLIALGKLDNPQLWVDMGVSQEKLDFLESVATPNVIIRKLEPGKKAEAWNLGLKLLDTPYLVLMHSFIHPLSDDWVEKLVESIETDETIATVAPMKLSQDGKVDHTGIVYLRGQPTRADMQVPQDWDRVGERRVFKGVTDDIMIIRRIRGFGLDFTWNFQDDEWCLAVTQEGYSCVYDPSIKVCSKLHATGSDKRYDFRGLLNFATRYGGIPFMDQFNDVANYYGTGQNLPSTESYIWKDEKGKGKIICFLADHDGCGYYRLKVPYKEMVKRGWDVVFTTYAPPEFVNWADVVVMQRQVETTMLDVIKLAHAQNKPCIYEIDDYFHGLPVTNPVMPNFARNPHLLRNMERIIWQCDALTVTTPGLAKKYGQFNTNTHIIPNHLDLSVIPEIKEAVDGQIRIGWAGSGTHDGDMKFAVNAVNRILGEYPNARLVIIGHDYRSNFDQQYKDQMEWLPATWGHEEPVPDYYQILNDARLDIGIAPLEDNQFNVGKSAIKTIEYGAWGIVCVASDVGPYTLFHNDVKEYSGEKSGYLCRVESDWYKFLKRLCDDRELLVAHGTRLQKYVWERKGAEHMADQIEQLILSLLAGYGHKPNKAEPVHSLAVSFLGNLTSLKAQTMVQIMKAANEST